MNQSAHLAAHGVEVVLTSSPGPTLEQIASSKRARAIPQPMTRSTSLRDDFTSLIRLIRTLRRECTDILYTHTPKAGLLATIAGRLTRVPVCIHKIHGLRVNVAGGSRRLLLRGTELVGCTLAQHVLCVSPPVLDLTEDAYVIRRGRGQMIGSGTLYGADLTDFDSMPARQDARAHGFRNDLLQVGRRDLGHCTLGARCLPTLDPAARKSSSSRGRGSRTITLSDRQF